MCVLLYYEQINRDGDGDNSNLNPIPISSLFPNLNS